MPAVPAGRRWGVLVIAVIVVAGGMAGWLIERNTPDPSVAIGGVQGTPGTSAAHPTPTGDGSPSTSTSALPTGPDGCSGEPAAPVGLLPGPPVAAVVTADYRFQDSLASSVGSAPDLVEIGHGSGGFADETVLGRTSTVLTFARGGGLSLAPASAVIESRGYTIELLFRRSRLGSYRKIIDFKDGSDDSGLYSLGGCLDFYPRPPASRATIDVDRYVQVVLTRDASARLVGYVDGVRQFSFPDTGELAVPDVNDTLRLFIDDATTQTEDSRGAVSRIRLYDRALTENEVAALACAELPSAICS